MSFVHLHVQSDYSLLEGTATPETLVARAAALGLPALALTDHNGLYGAVRFARACQAASLQPLLGLELDTAEGDRLVLLARDRAGYRSLCRLSSAVLRQPARHGRRRGCSWDVLRAEVTGLIALTGGPQALVPTLVRQGELTRASRLLGAYSALFGAEHLFVELVLHEDRDAALVRELVRLADTLSLPTVAANAVLCATAEEVPTAELVAAIRTRTTLATPHPDKVVPAEGYLKSAGQMRRLFADYPQALAHSRYIAHQCALELPLGQWRFPAVALPKDETAFSHLWPAAGEPKRGGTSTVTSGPPVVGSQERQGRSAGAMQRGRSAAAGLPGGRFGMQ